MLTAQTRSFHEERQPTRSVKVWYLALTIRQPRPSHCGPVSATSLASALRVSTSRIGFLTRLFVKKFSTYACTVSQSSPTIPDTFSGAEKAPGPALSSLSPSIAGVRTSGSRSGANRVKIGHLRSSSTVISEDLKITSDGGGASRSSGTAAGLGWTFWSSGDDSSPDSVQLFCHRKRE